MPHQEQVNRQESRPPVVVDSIDPIFRIFGIPLLSPEGLPSFEQVEKKQVVVVTADAGSSNIKINFWLVGDVQSNRSLSPVTPRDERGRERSLTLEVDTKDHTTVVKARSGEFRCIRYEQMGSLLSKIKQEIDDQLERLAIDEKAVVILLSAVTGFTNSLVIFDTVSNRRIALLDEPSPSTSLKPGQEKLLLAHISGESEEERLVKLRKLMDKPSSLAKMIFLVNNLELIKDLIGRPGIRLSDLKLTTMIGLLAGEIGGESQPAVPAGELRAFGVDNYQSLRAMLRDLGFEMSPPTPQSRIHRLGNPSLLKTTEPFSCSDFEAEASLIEKMREIFDRLLESTVFAGIDSVAKLVVSKQAFPKFIKSITQLEAYLSQRMAGNINDIWRKRIWGQAISELKPGESKYALIDEMLEEGLQLAQRRPVLNKEDETPVKVRSIFNFYPTKRDGGFVVYQPSGATQLEDGSIRYSASQIESLVKRAVGDCADFELTEKEIRQLLDLAVNRGMFFGIRAKLDAIAAQNEKPIDQIAAYAGYVGFNNSVDPKLITRRLFAEAMAPGVEVLRIAGMPNAGFAAGVKVLRELNLDVELDIELEEVDGKPGSVEDYYREWLELLGTAGFRLDEWGVIYQ